VAPAESTLWGGVDAKARASLMFPAEMALDVGAVVVPLAAYGVMGGVWSRSRRIALAIATSVTVILAAGTTVAGGILYRVLFEHAPGWRGIRTPGRLVVLVSLGLALLAAAGVEALRRSTRWHRIIGVGLVALVLLDGYGSLPVPRVPPPAPGLADASDPVFVLPSSDILDMHVMWASTRGFPRIVNGGSGFTPELLAEVRRRTVAFPDADSVRYLRALGVRSVVLRTRLLPGTPWAGADSRATNGLPVTVREVSGDLVFNLAP
jgi:hypothetical protein